MHHMKFISTDRISKNVLIACNISRFQDLLFIKMNEMYLNVKHYSYYDKII